MKPASQDIKLGSSVEIVSIYPNSRNHFRLVGSALSVCGVWLPAGHIQARGSISSASTVHCTTYIHRIKAKTDCIKCAQQIFNAIHNVQSTDSI